jgi:hypothetical protein
MHVGLSGQGLDPMMRVVREYERHVDIDERLTGMVFESVMR